MKFAVMADGGVGSAVARFLLTKHPADLAALVLRDRSAIEAQPQIAQLAANCGAPVLTWDERNALRPLGLDVLLLAWWPYLLKGTDLALASTILNMHPSLLPHCRGKDPNFWALAEDRPFGVTIHHVEDKVDAGPIAFQREIPTDWESTGGSLYTAAQEAMVDLFIENYPAISAGLIPRIRQDFALGGAPHKRADLEPASSIDLDELTTARKLLNKVRARTFPPHPACKFTDKGVAYEVTVNIRKVGEIAGSG
jgi:methionyl-tRNA formyltransferase